MKQSEMVELYSQWRSKTMYTGDEIPAEYDKYYEWPEKKV